MSTLQFDVSYEDEKLIQWYAEKKQIAIEDLIREAVLEKIEDEIDLRLFEEAAKEYKQNPVSYTLDEVMQKMGMDSNV